MLRKSLIFVLLVILQISCTKEDSPEKNKSFVKEKIYGTLQTHKENFSQINLISKDDNLNNTGLLYSTAHDYPKGFFEFKNIKLNSNFIELSYSGGFQLSAIADISKSSVVQINLLTHIEKRRIEYLIKKEDKTFSEASKIAQQELLKNFDIENDEIVESRFISFLSGSEEGAILIAVTYIIGSYDANTINALIKDFETDGILSEATFERIYRNVSKLNLKSIRNDYINKYRITPSDFEKYIINFREKQVDSIYQVTYDITDNVCFEGEEGEIKLNIEGGVPPYTYYWSNGERTEKVSGLKSGKYSVTINDANKIQKKIKDIEVIDLSDQKISITAETKDIIDSVNGSILPTITGGTPPYTYLWSNGETNKNLDNITIKGDYKLTVTDSNGCNTEKEFTVYEYQTVKDIEGNVYRAVKFGTTTWMIDNLRVTKFNDGTDLSYSNNVQEWSVNGANYTHYNFDKQNVSKYGKVYYDIETVNSSSNICPKGWKIPSKNDCNNLIEYINKPPYFFKEFNIIKSGCLVYSYIDEDAKFELMDQALYWTSSSYNAESQKFMIIPDLATPYISISKENGLCIRCIKDE